MRFVAVEHGVEDTGQAIEFAAGLAGGRNALVQIAADDAACRRRDRVDAAEHLAVEKDAEPDGDDEQYGEGDQQGFGERRLHARCADPIAADQDLGAVVSTRARPKPRLATPFARVGLDRAARRRRRSGRAAIDVTSEILPVRSMSAWMARSSLGVSNAPARSNGPARRGLLRCRRAAIASIRNRRWRLGARQDSFDARIDEEEAADRDSGDEGECQGGEGKRVARNEEAVGKAARRAAHGVRGEAVTDAAHGVQQRLRSRPRSSCAGG